MLKATDAEITAYLASEQYAIDKALAFARHDAIRDAEERAGDVTSPPRPADEEQPAG